MVFFNWVENTAIGAAIRESEWLFAALESAHLLALGILAGTVIAVDFRLLNIGFKHQSVVAIARDLRPWFIGAVIAAFSTGIPMFMSQAVRLSESPPFWWKMTLLAIVLVFTLVARRRVIAAQALSTSLARKLTALISMTLWGSIMFSGKWIGYY